MINNNFITGLILANRAKKNLENKGADVSKNFQLKNALIFGMTGSNTLVPQLVLQKEVEKNEPDITTVGLQKIAALEVVHTQKVTDLEAAHAKEVDVCKKETTDLKDSYIKTCQALNSARINDKLKAEIKATIPQSVVDAAVPVLDEATPDNEPCEDEMPVIIDRKVPYTLESLVHIGPKKAGELHKAGIHTFEDVMNDANEKIIKKHVSPNEFVTIKAKAQQGIEIKNKMKELNTQFKKLNSVSLE